MSLSQSTKGILVGIFVAGLLGGCTTPERYASYKKEFQQDHVEAGKFQLMTGDPHMSGQNYYARLTSSNGIWTSEVSTQRFRRTNERQELFVIDAGKMQIKPDFVTARGDDVIVPDKYQTVICPPDIISGGLKKVKYTVCMTAFAASLGSVKWTEMAAAVAGSDLSEKILGMAAARDKDAAQAEAHTKAVAARVREEAMLRAAQDKEKYQLAKRDSDTRADRYRLGADQGDADAQNNLGMLYKDGQGVPQDYKEAARWYRRAADQGHAIAQSNLGVMYEGGQGVPASKVGAYALYNLSASNDPSSKNKATANRSKIAEKMSNQEIEAAQDLTQAIAKPGNLLKALDQYGKRPAIREASKPVAAKDVPARVATAGPYPAHPAKVAGVISCNTSCENAACYRTYDDGRKVKFQAKQKWNPFNNQFEFDSGSC